MASPRAPDVPRSPEGLPATGVDRNGFWCRFQQLLERIRGGEQAWTFTERSAAARRRFDPLEREWARELPEVEQAAGALLRDGDDRGRSVLADFTERCFRQALGACEELLDRFADESTRAGAE